MRTLFSFLLAPALLAQITELASQPAALTAGLGSNLLVTCRIADPNVLPDSVLLQRLDGASAVTGTFGNLRDDGANGDVTAGDGVFSGRFGVQEGTPGLLRMRVSAGLRGSARRILSGVLELPVSGMATSIRILSPARDAYLSLSPVVVRGQIGDPSLNVTVNGIAAVKSGNTFSATVPLIEGTNNIAAVALGVGGASSTDTLQVVLDTTPPRVTITTPTDGFRTTAAALAISGIVNDIVVGTVNPAQASVTVNGVLAAVANRTFTAPNIPLQIGTNAIRAEGRDQAGNTFAHTIVVTREVPPPATPTLSLLSGNNQSAFINTNVPAPLVVQLRNGAGQAVAGVPVTFRVTDNNGLVDGLPATVVNSDGQGQARVALRLGSRGGAGSNRVEAFSTGYTGTALFTASGTPAPPARIVVDSGLNQTGATGRALPFPFVAIVTDAGNNRVAGVPVTFAVRSGGGNINGQNSFVVQSDSDGRATATLTLGLEEGTSNNVVEATFLANPGQPAVFAASALTPGPVSSTTISGVVQDNSGLPIPGVTIRLFQLAQGATNGLPQQIGTPVTTDAQGFFRMLNAPVGTMKLMADGSTALPGGAWPTVEFDLVTVAGRDNGIGMPIYLPRLDQVNRLCVSPTTGGTLTLPQSPGFSLTVAPGSATFPGGSRTGCISVTPVNPDRVPMVPGFGQQPRFVVTIQPVGTMFNPPAQITIPNVDGLAPREKTEMYSYDHDLASFVAIGTGSVSEDGSVIASDPGVGVIKAGWHCGGNPNPTGSAGTCPTCQRCGPGGCLAAPGSCDDGKFCTSADGLTIGADSCANGSCRGRAIDDQETVGGQRSYDISNLKRVLSGAAESLNFAPGCRATDPSFAGAIRVSGVRTCCETQRQILSGTRLGGSASYTLPGVECFVPGLSVNLRYVGVGVSVGVSLSGNVSGSGTQSACTDQCKTQVGGDATATITGSVRVATIFDPAYVSIAIGVRGQGSLSVSDSCGDITVRGCAGPIQLFGTITLAGFIDTGVDYTIPNSQVCTN